MYYEQGQMVREHMTAHEWKTEAMSVPGTVKVV